MSTIVFFLCAVTSVICAGLLIRAYRKNKNSLVFWCAIGFVGMSINNVLLIFDKFVVQTDLLLFRTGSLMLGMMLMLFGLIWNTV
ncbi:MAG: DUF5985 family protein [Pseudobdellovibrionaceae bacterium]